MEKINLIKPEKINLKDHPILNEHWLQNIIAKDSEILGLGDLVLKDKERKQPRAGRLDILLQDAEIKIDSTEKELLQVGVKIVNLTKLSQSGL